MKIFRWLNNINLPVKMSLIGAFALLGVAFPSYFYITLLFESQKASEIELNGIEPTAIIVKVMKGIAEQRGLSTRYLDGDESVSNKLDSISIEIKKGLDNFSTIFSGSFQANDIISRSQQLAEELSSLADQVKNHNMTSEESFVKYSNLIQKAKKLVFSLMQVTGLNYDPNAASYHLIIANFENLPRLANDLAAMRELGSGALTRKLLSEKENVSLSNLENTIYYHLSEFTDNYAASGAADKKNSKLAAMALGFGNDLNRLILTTNKEIVKSGNISYSAETYFADFSQVLNKLDQFFEMSNAELASAIETRIAKTASERNSEIVIIFVLLTLAGLFGFIVVRSLTRSVVQLIDSSEGIARGDFNHQFDTERKDELGLLSKSLANMNSQLQQASVIAQESLKIKQGLDNCSTCFMMADEDRNIIYTNKSVETMLKDAEQDIRKDLPQFSADNLIGASIDQFHKNPAHQKTLLANLTSQYTANIKIGGRNFGLIANPIHDAQGKKIGTSVEWQDKTAIVKAERETTRILESLNATTTNVMIADAERNIIYMNKSVKSMLEESESDIRKALPHFSVNKILSSNMDIFHKDPTHQRVLLENLKSTYEAQITVGRRHFRLIANPIFSQSGERLGSVVEWLDRTLEVQAEEDVSRLVNAAARGDFSERIETGGKNGFMLRIAEALNALIEMTESGLSDVSNVLMAISEGDLTKQIEKDYLGTFDDLKNYCNQTASYLSNMISEIREASETISSASSEIAQGNADLSSRTEEQASSLEETASSMEELTGTVRLNAENANQANGLASKASGVAIEGGELIQQVVSTMASINESAQKISDIIGVIDGIAFQTNILALNAAVEAARAGEQGRGFAVVASEVRTLAQRSANAAKDIKALISDSVAKIDSGNSLVNRSGSTMQEIVVAIKRVNDIMAEIAAASAEQASGIDEVGKAITQMDEVTQQNAALVEEAAAAAESMQSQAEQLSRRVATFKTDTSTQAVSRPTLALPDKKAKQKNVKPRTTGRIVKPADPDEDEWESF